MLLLSARMAAPSATPAAAPSTAAPPASTVAPPAAAPPAADAAPPASTVGAAPPAKARASSALPPSTVYSAPIKNALSQVKPEEAKQLPLANRSDEPDFKLTMPLEIVTFTCANDKKPVYCDVTIKNTTPDRQSFKVKCTSAEIFRVQPPLGFIRPGQTQNIRVWFQNKAMPVDKEKHYFAFYHMKATDVKLKEKDIWTKTAKPDGVRRLRAVFQEKK